jgi:hypothetical protein
VDKELKAFYTTLLAAIDAPVFREGDWQLCERSGWPDNSSARNLVAWSWVKGADRRLIVVNLCGAAVQGHVQVPWENPRESTWRLTDMLSHASFARHSRDFLSPGLYVELGPWGFHLFECESTCNDAEGAPLYLN